MSCDVGVFPISRPSVGRMFEVDGGRCGGSGGGRGGGGGSGGVVLLV